MASKSSKKGGRNTVTKPTAATKEQARTNAAEEQRLEAKSDRVRAYLAEARKREAESTAQGYFY
jgi:hypothetical protein